MGDKTGISWTDATWNPVRGCSRVSAGCQHCYAERVANRFSGPGKPYEGLVSKFGRWNGVVRMVPKHFADPISWKRPRRIFVNSMSDLFHESLSNEQIAAVFGVMAAAPQHTFQILTKRAKRMREWFEWLAAEACGEGLEPGVLHSCWGEYIGTLDDPPPAIQRLLDDEDNVADHAICDSEWPLRSVWLGVSVENQAAADERIPELLRTPAAIRFISAEPLLGPVDLEEVRHQLGASSFETASVLEGNDGFGLSAPRNRLDWVIVGCESGPGARPCEVEWLRSLRDQCAAVGVAYFLKQAVELLTTRAVYPSAQADRVTTVHVSGGDGSKRKSGGVIELPYLDGVQHANFPESP